jgi:hypothetical protein
VLDEAAAITRLAGGGKQFVLQRRQRADAAAADDPHAPAQRRQMQQRHSRPAPDHKHAQRDPEHEGRMQQQHPIGQHLRGDAEKRGDCGAAHGLIIAAA